MKNPETGKYEVKKVFKSTNEEIVGTGDTKEEAKADLLAKLQEYRVPGSDFFGYKGPKYAPKLVVVGYVNSPGFVAVVDDDGKVQYKYDANKKAQVKTSQRLANALGLVKK